MHHATRLLQTLVKYGLMLALTACGGATGATTASSGASANGTTAAASTAASGTGESSPAANATASAVGAAEASGSGQSTATGTQIRAVATTSILADLITNVGGDRVTVTALLPPGADPHTFAPSPNEARAVADSQILIENGAGLEEWLAELIDNAGGERPTVVASEGVTPIEGFEHEEHAEDTEHADEEHSEASEAAAASGEGDEHADEAHAEAGVDPHMWFDPNNVVIYVENIRDGLTQVDPDGAATYEANAARYIEQLRARRR